MRGRQTGTGEEEEERRRLARLQVTLGNASVSGEMRRGRERLPRRSILICCPCF